MAKFAFPGEHTKTFLAVLTALIVLVATVIFAPYVLGRNFEIKARTLIGQSRHEVTEVFGQPDDVVSISEVTAGLKRFPPDGFVLKPDYKLTSEVLVYRNALYGNICVFINKDERVEAVARAVS